MHLDRDRFIHLTPQDLQEDGFEKVNLDDPDEYLSPFYQTRIGIWVYEWHRSKWRLRAIEMNASELNDTSPSEREKIANLYGLDAPVDVLLSLFKDQIHIIDDSAGDSDYLHVFIFFDGLIYLKIHDRLNVFSGLLICDIASCRLDRSLPESINCLEDILVCKDTVHPAASLNSLLNKVHPSNIIIRTGIFRQDVR
jgi:hypothetical protein